jgi:ribonuclease Z
MKLFRWLLMVVVVIAVIGFVLRGPLLDRIAQWHINESLNRVDTSLLTDGKLHVILCGTAAALPDPNRAGPCAAVIAGGQFVLFDAGPASWRVVDRLNLPTAKLSAVVITHLHSDHIGGLGEAIEQSWINGRAAPLNVYGPPGIDDVVNGFALVYRHDVGYRVAHHGPAAMPPEAASAVAHIIPPPTGTDRFPVFEANGLVVEAFRVDHAPIDFAYGYRVSYRGRIVVISGDTKPCESVVVNAKDADLLLHEALARSLTERASQIAKDTGKPRMSQLVHDIGGYHSTPVEAAQVAQKAGVHELVLTHIFPPVGNALARHLFLEGAADAYSGKLVLGEDGMRFDLGPVN